SGVLVGRGVLRNPWILAQAADLASNRPAREVTMRDRGLFLLNYIELLISERDNEVFGFRHSLSAEPWAANAIQAVAQGRDCWVITKLRSLFTWYSKGCDQGSHFRVRVNSAASIRELREIIEEFFLTAQRLPVGQSN